MHIYGLSYEKAECPYPLLQNPRRPNPAAIQIVAIRRHDFDEEGNPYPMLYMRLNKKRMTTIQFLRTEDEMMEQSNPDGGKRRSGI